MRQFAIAARATMQSQYRGMCNGFGICTLAMACLALTPALQVSPVFGAEEIKEKEEYATRLFIGDSDGSNMKPLTKLPEFQTQGSATWSPDLKTIAFDGWKSQNGENFSATKVILVDADGGNPRVLADGAMPSYSPEGHRIAYSSPKGGGTWIMSDKGPADEHLQLDPQGWGVKWARNGKIAYASRGAEGANLVVFDFVEGRAEYLFPKRQCPYARIVENMAWSPDSKRIAFKGVTAEGKSEIGIIDTRGEKFGFVRRFEGQVEASMAWTADGARLVFIAHNPDRARWQLHTADPDSKDPPQLFPKQDPLRDYYGISISPDGKKMIVSCTKARPKQ